MVTPLIKLALFTFLLIFLAISVFPELSPIQNQSLAERQTLSIVPRGTIANNPILGIGQGQLVWSMRNNPDILDWQFQPVHNVFLLIWSELGLIGLIVFIWLLWKMFRPGTKLFHVEQFWAGGTFVVFRGVLLGLTFIMLFDHYLWDIQQSQALLWIVIGLTAGLAQKRDDNTSLTY